MTFFPDPLRPSEGREEDKYRVNPIEADKKGKENLFDKLPEGKKRPKAYTAFLVFIDKLTKAFGKGQKGTLEEDQEDTLTGKYSRTKSNSSNPYGCRAK